MTKPSGLAGFPPGNPDRPDVPDALAAAGIRFRPADRRDLAFLRRLFGSFRAAELATVPWPPRAKESFLDEQFTLQHKHFVTHFPRADFLVLERAATPVGRFYLDRSGPNHLIVDIGLLPEWQGQGLGRALIADSQARARAAGAQGVELHVAPNNPGARRLYERLGFREIGRTGAHAKLQWPALAIFG
ncbi:MAG TPA: N-acetyltransferase [Aliidongia sp.]|nr:N-acetyltransferase [Aliidongia sp.]